MLQSSTVHDLVSLLWHDRPVIDRIVALGLRQFMLHREVGGTTWLSVGIEAPSKRRLLIGML